MDTLSSDLCVLVNTTFALVTESSRLTFIKASFVHYVNFVYEDDQKQACGRVGGGGAALNTYLQPKIKD